MILDNQNENLKVHEWISKYTLSGNLSIVTGYFTVGALAYLSKQTRNKIEKYRFVLGDIVNFDPERDRALDLLNENITIEASVQLSALAKEAVSFLKLEKVEIKTLEPNFCHAKLYLYKHSEKDPQRDYYITGSSNLTEAGVGLKTTNNVELNTVGTGTEANYSELVKWFDTLWQKPQAHLEKTITDEKGNLKKINFKKYLIDEISKIFKLYTPEQLYYKVLFELFGDDLLKDKDNPELNRQIGKLENTIIYKSLYEFQQKGVISLIKMLQKYNGAILADAVGLGKTWSALAVMKFFEMQGHKVILLCPKKLERNWCKYLEPDNKFEHDNIDFKYRFHTDLINNRWDHHSGKNKYTVRKMLDDKPKLLVIDESHNLRNNKSNRYKFLVDEILAKSKGNIKVLMLSATPINNSLNDIRNQFKLITGGNENGFEESLDVKNIDSTFKKAQTEFKDWVQMDNPRLGDFIKKLPDNFFKLTNALLVARTRKLITGHQNNLYFPKKHKPENIFITPKQIGNFESFEELFDHFPPTLCGYSPSFYIRDYEKPDILHDEKQRDRFLIKMMYILLVKRLESSWFSFQSTVEKILDHHQNALDKIINYQKTKNDNNFLDEQLNLFADEELEEELESFSLGKKRITRIADIDRSGKIEDYKKDLKADIEQLQLLLSNLNQFQTKIEKEIKKPNNLRSADDKLEALIDRINKKKASGYNNGNQKLVIFTVYKDTAFYLFNQLKARGFEKIAAISGDVSQVWNEDHQTNKFENILERFAPYTQLFIEKEWQFKPSPDALKPQDKFEEWKVWIAENEPEAFEKLQHPIDIIITTDVLSEGQNLQDADMVINYDIHWNPVRVIQRMGRIDRLGSPNETIYGINFWPSSNINSYLNLQGRIEHRMAQMKLAGSEVNLEFSDTFRDMAENESLEQKQKDKMMRQMESTWDEIDGGQNLGFDDFSLENFRQDLLEELKDKESFYKSMPKGVYTGFVKNKTVCTQEGIIALMGYPARPAKSDSFTYKGYELIYINLKGEAILLNQKEVLDALSKHKNETRYVPEEVDNGKPDAIQKLSDALIKWLHSKAVSENIQEDGSKKQTVGTGTLDLINKIKSGSKEAINQLKTEGKPADKFSKDNFDLIVWFVVS